MLSVSGSERSDAPDRRPIRDQPASSMPQQERVVDDLLQRAHLAGAHDLPALFQRHAEALGVEDAVTYLVDLQQSALVPFLPPSGPQQDERLTPLGVDSTLAGRAFQQSQPLVQPLDPNDPDGTAVRIWLPLLDGTERLGVLAVTAPDAALLGDDAALLVRLRLFAALAAELVMSKTLYGDTLVRLRRSSQMGLAAEMQWSLLPPLTFSTSSVTVAGALEPAYEVAGDSVDYAVDDAVTRFAVFDGMGHGLRSAQLATLTVAAYRNGRRANRSLTTTAVTMDQAVASAFEGDVFITGVVVELDTDSGTLTWINAGHPSPLLLRDGRLVKELDTEPMLPFGLNDALDTGEEIELGVEQLEPRDIVLLYTDGVVEARSPGGVFFGVEQLVDLITRHLASGLAAPETMRRISHALLDHQQAQLDDDATLMLVQWRPTDLTQMVP
jgi:serine phosphatase RsbU (regulator of sigma subunit)